jgi:DNA-binding NtrC family response regulator
MEYISGLYFLKMIREHDGLKHIKFMMMFVDMNRDLFVGAIDAGADAYIHMPYDPVRLKKSIDNIFDTVP